MNKNSTEILIYLRNITNEITISIVIDIYLNIEKRNPLVAKEIIKKIKTIKKSQDLYFWLEEKVKEHSLEDKKIDNLMTDLFFSIH